MKNFLAMIALFSLFGCATNDGRIYQYKKKFDSGIGFEQAKAQCEYEKLLLDKADSRADKGGIDLYSVLGQQNPTFVSCVGRFGYSWEPDLDLTELNQAQQFYLNKDYHKSFDKYKSMALRGNATAQSWIGYFYQNDFVVFKDLNESFRWYKLSAIQGLKESQVAVSNYYLYGAGPGFKIDLVKSYFWAKLASASGSVIDFTQFDKRMSKIEFEEANEILSRCKTLGLKNCAI